jgi:hypothetical protein
MQQHRLLIEETKRMRRTRNDNVAIVLLENIWWSFRENPGHASIEPFIEGLARYNDNAKCYRLTFYDKSSFRKALEAAATLPPSRLVLHIGAHAENRKVGGVDGTQLLSNLKTTLARRSGMARAEGLILSSCSAGKHESAILSAFGSGLRWVFAYRSDVDWLGSTLIDTCLLEEVCRLDEKEAADPAALLDAFAEGLRKFNPDWVVDEDDRNSTLRTSIAFWVKPSRGQARDETSALIKKAWGAK